MALDLDRERAASALLKHCRWTEADRRELEPGLRRVLVAFYARVATDADRTAELLPRVDRAVLDRLTRQDAKRNAILDAVKAEKSVPHDVLRGILHRMGDTARSEQRLRAKADEFVALYQCLRRLTNDDPDVRRLREEGGGASAAR